jgi:hypothetical protein
MASLRCSTTSTASRAMVSTKSSAQADAIAETCDSSPRRSWTHRVAGATRAAPHSAAMRRCGDVERVGGEDGDEAAQQEEERRRPRAAAEDQPDRHHQRRQVEHGEGQRRDLHQQRSVSLDQRAMR